MDFSNMEVTIDHIADAGAKIKAYATVTFDGMFKVHGVRQARYRTRDSKSMFFLLNPGRTESVVRLPGADARRCTALDPFTGTITQERLNRDWTVPAVRGIFIIIEE